MVENPGQAKNIDSAKKIILSFQKEEDNAPEEIKERVWQSVLSRTQMPKVITMRKSRGWLAVAAAIFVLVLGGTAWYFLNNNPESASPAIAKQELKNELLPGGNKATLTLADGNTIILDSTNIGMLASQGNAQIIKLDDGKLVYQESAINKQQTTIQYNTITTPRGGQYQLALADGSQVWLNAASSITFPTSFTGNHREIKMTGEAYFEVAHNANMPFHVTVNGMDVKVLGTHFNVNAYEDEGETKTTLLEGSVKVTFNEQSKIISPDQQIILTNKSGKLVVEKNINTDEIMAWKNGKFYFNEANIQSIMKQVSRWYNVDVEYKGEINKLFEGTISRQVSVGDIFKILSATGGVHFEIEGRKIIVSP